MKIQELIGRNVRQAREEAGLSQRELGERVGWVLEKPWLPQAVSKAEKGDREGRFRDWAAEDLIAVAYALKRPVAWFLRVPDGVNPWETLELPGNPTGLHLEWVSGEATASRTPVEIVAEIARLTKELGRAVAPTVEVETTVTVGVGAKKIPAKTRGRKK
jgi:transcriptional regulator with XRE-family HTH domain